MQTQLPLTQLIDLALSGDMTFERLEQLASQSSTSAPELLNQLSIYVAKCYATEQLAYDEADAVMNAAFCLATSPELWAAYDRTAPEDVMRVYMAFDEGEYHHPDDARDIDPEIKYTKPLITQFLRDKQLTSKHQVIE
ncbi:hypothetical protein KSF73_00900 [Burkholderiaceae bacterium DAT-1]|nr:hypothetical protein [Burkholderiaceae bacterium DAT-1]